VQGAKEDKLMKCLDVVFVARAKNSRYIVKLKLFICARARKVTRMKICELESAEEDFRTGLRVMSK
jgi:hypothetical protein